jgi:DNA-binding beta-propeller fold protein YncE
MPARSLASPGCSAATVRQAALSRVRTAMVAMPYSPFGAAVTPDGKWAFVAVAGQIEVLRSDGSLRPVLVRTIPVPGSAVGEAITGDGRYLLAADGSGAVVVSVARAEQARRMRSSTRSGLGDRAGQATTCSASQPPGCSPRPRTPSRPSSASASRRWG